MEGTEKKTSYFSRLKKKRQLKNQSEKTNSEQNQSDLNLKIPVIPETPVIDGSLERNTEQAANGGSGISSKSCLQKKREKSRPPGSVEYTVGATDTVNSVALKFNITPNELVHLNRLFSHSLVPGQKLFVPDVGELGVGSLIEEAPERSELRDAEWSGRSEHHFQRETSPLSEDDSPVTVKFIKMSCKLFTDGMGVVGGVMIITPNNIMFDPHKSDPLVLENGCEEYGLICPLEELLSVALYEDVSRMSLQDALPSPSEWEELPSERDLNPFSRYQTPVAEQMKTSASEACEIQIGERSPSDEGFTELEILQLDLKSKTQTEQTESDLPEEEDEGLHSRSTDLLQSTSVLLHDEEPVAPRTRIIEEMQTEDSGAITEERAETDAQKNRRASEAEMKAWLMKRMQRPIEDMLLTKEEKSKAPPMFLCFKVGKPMRKSFVFGITSSPAHSSPSRGRQLEYWFAVPQERVEDLYWFFIRCSPDSYGSETQEQGFVLVEKEQLTMIDDFFSDPVPRSWEIITMNEIKRRQSLSFEEPLDLLPVLLETSAFLQDMHTNKLCSVLPARVQAHPWHLLYSTDLHGTSLKTLYRNLLEVERPVLLVVKDSDSQVFGAFSTHPFRVSEHYYGTGETFLFSFCPELKVFHWTGENSYFVKGNLDSLQIGGGGGRLGLWLDADLYHGTSSKCSTFNNLPLSSKQDFTVQSLEVWVFE